VRRRAAYSLAPAAPHPSSQARQRPLLTTPRPHPLRANPRRRHRTLHGARRTPAEQLDLLLLLNRSTSAPPPPPPPPPPDHQPPPLSSTCAVRFILHARDVVAGHQPTMDQGPIGTLDTRGRRGAEDAPVPGADPAFAPAPGGARVSGCRGRRARGDDVRHVPPGVTVRAHVARPARREARHTGRDSSPQRSS